MAFVPSDQNLGRHPKTERAAEILGVSIPHLLGHLHLLWHWAMEFAQDGDLSHYDDATVARAARWEGDPAAFYGALAGCGSGGKAGFIEEPGRVLHDWDEYGGKAFARRDHNARRMRDYRQRQRAASAPLAAEPVVNDAPPPPEPPTAAQPRRTRAATSPTILAQAERFEITDELRAWAKQHLPEFFDLAGQTEFFLDYIRSNRPKWTDIASAWRNWMRRAATDPPPSPGGGRRGRAPAQARPATFDPEKYRQWRNGEGSDGQ